MRETFFLTLLNRSAAAGWVVLAVLLLRLLLGKAPKWIRVVLWGFAAFRLIAPVSPESRFSLVRGELSIPQDVYKRQLQNSPTKSMQKIGPREKQSRFSRGPFFIACFEFLVQIAFAFSCRLSLRFHFIPAPCLRRKGLTVYFTLCRINLYYNL